MVLDITNLSWSRESPRCEIRPRLIDVGHYAIATINYGARMPLPFHLKFRLVEKVEQIAYEKNLKGQRKSNKNEGFLFESKANCH